MRIDTTDPEQRWRLRCPTPARHVDWRVVDGHFECRACDETFDALVTADTGERVPREDVTLVGPHVDAKAAPDGGERV